MRHVERRQRHGRTKFGNQPLWRRYGKVFVRTEWQRRRESKQGTTNERNEETRRDYNYEYDGDKAAEMKQ